MHNIMFAFFGLGLFGLLFGIAYLAFWLWMLLHAITNKGLANAEKIVWVLVIFFLPFLGSILYFFIGKPKG